MCGICIHVEAMCGHMYMCGSMRKTLGTLLYHSLLYFFETESLTEAGAQFFQLRWQPASSSNPPPPTPSTRVTRMYSHAWLFT